MRRVPSLLRALALRADPACSSSSIQRWALGEVGQLFGVVPQQRPFGALPSVEPEAAATAAAMGGAPPDGAVPQPPQDEQQQQGPPPRHQQRQQPRRQPQQPSHGGAGQQPGRPFARQPSRSSGAGRQPPPSPSKLERRQVERQFVARVHEATTCREVVEVVRREATQRPLRAREVTVACSRLGRLYADLYRRTRRSGGDADHHLSHCQEMFGAALERVPALDCQALAQAAWMCSRFLWLPPPEQRAAWEAALWQRRHGFTTVTISNVLFSLGVVRWPAPQPLVDALLDSALAQRRALTPQAVCNILWGSCRAGTTRGGARPSPERLEALLEALLPLLPAFSPESFCTAFHSLAVLRVRPDDAALSTMLDAFEAQVEGATLRQLVTVAWSLGALSAGGLVTERLWERANAALVARAGEACAQTAPFFLFGAARLRLPPSDDAMQVVLESTWQFRDALRTGDISIVLWALARLGHKTGDGRVTRAFVQGMFARYAEHDREQPGTLRHASSLLYAATQLREPVPPGLFATCLARVDAAASADAGRLSSLDAHMLLVAFEQLGSAEGLAVLKRHLMRAGAAPAADAGPEGELDPGEPLELGAPAGAV